MIGMAMQNARWNTNVPKLLDKWRLALGDLVCLSDYRKPTRPKLIHAEFTPAQDLAYALALLRLLRAADVFEDARPYDGESPDGAA